MAYPCLAIPPMQHCLQAATLCNIGNFRQFTSLFFTQFTSPYFRQITSPFFRQFTSPYVLDSLKPQLKLVQSSVGDQEVMDYHHIVMRFKMHFNWTLYRDYQTLPDNI